MGGRLNLSLSLIDRFNEANIVFHSISFRTFLITEEYLASLSVCVSANRDYGSKSLLYL